MTVEPGGTRLPAELSPVPRRAGARAVCLVALSMNALAVLLTALTPQPLPAVAASRVLVARGVVAVTLHGAVPPRPPGVANAPSRRWVTHGVDAAVAVVVALRPPGARVARAFARLLVALALLTQADVLTVGSPAVVVACALAGQVITLAIWITVTFPFAVGAPKLGRALCLKQIRDYNDIPPIQKCCNYIQVAWQISLLLVSQLAPKYPWRQRHSLGRTHTSFSLQVKFPSQRADE